MRPNAVDLGLRNGSHSDLVKGSREEGGKGRDEDNVPVPTGQSDSHAYHVLLGNKTLDESLGELILVGEGKGRVLGVAIQGYNTIIVLSQFDQSVAVRLAGSNLNKKYISLLSFSYSLSLLLPLSHPLSSLLSHAISSSLSTHLFPHLIVRRGTQSNLRKRNLWCVIFEW